MPENSGEFDLHLCFFCGFGSDGLISGGVTAGHLAVFRPFT